MRRRSASSAISRRAVSTSGSSGIPYVLLVPLTAVAKSGTLLQAARLVSTPGFRARVRQERIGEPYFGRLVRAEATGREWIFL